MNRIVYLLSNVLKSVIKIKHQELKITMYVEWLKKQSDKSHPRAWDFVQLVRLDKPIGIYLLLWPTLSALWIAGEGSPSVKNVIIFTLGVMLMRSAGCVINDFADRDFDGHVARTKDRPLAGKRVTPTEAFTLFFSLLAICFLLVLCTNKVTFYLSFGAIAVAACYPFMKRFTHYPQVVLGAAYSWGILMAFTAETNQLPWYAWLLFLANVAWTVAFDTYYAMSDREDDLRIGVKSTAIAFGQYDRTIIVILQAINLLGIAIVGLYLGFGWYFYLGLLIAVVCFIWEYSDTISLDPMRCFKAFLHNHWAGLAIWVGIVIEYLVH